MRTEPRANWRADENRESEVPLVTYDHFAGRDQLHDLVLERMLAGVWAGSVLPCAGAGCAERGRGSVLGHEPPDEPGVAVDLRVDE